MCLTAMSMYMLLFYNILQSLLRDCWQFLSRCSGEEAHICADATNMHSGGGRAISAPTVGAHTAPRGTPPLLGHAVQQCCCCCCCHDWFHSGPRSWSQPWSWDGPDCPVPTHALKFRPTAWWACWPPPTVPGDQWACSIVPLDFTGLRFVLPNKINLQNEYTSTLQNENTIFCNPFPILLGDKKL